MTAFYDAELAAVDGLGLTDIDMDLIVSLLDDYVRGAARGAVEAAEAQAHTGVSDQQWWQTYGPLLAEVLDPARYPTAVRVGSAAGAEYGAAHDPARSFKFGLQRIIDGIEAFIPEASPEAITETPPEGGRHRWSNARIRWGTPSRSPPNISPSRECNQGSGYTVAELGAVLVDAPIWSFWWD